MDETPDNLSAPSLSESSAGIPSPVKIDPKLLEKALKKMKGLIHGNGLSTDKVTLVDTAETTPIQMFRFKARTSLKIVPHYGVKIEPGRNTAAELMPSESEFKRALAQIAIDARTNPIKRKQIIDFMFQRSDKGFGIKEQRTKFHALSRDFVQHERCATCAQTGRIMCAKCHGKGMSTCPRCLGRRHVHCPRCRGSTRIETSQGTVACTFCRADGRVNCTQCGANGQVKCQNCAATGSTACRTCGATGWMSHLAHIEVFAQINFDFEKEGLPPLLVQSIDKNPSRCIEKHEIEVAISKSSVHDDYGSILGHSDQPSTNQIEPEDTIWIDYEALCPFGPITFKIDNQDVSGHLFGFQTRLIAFPYFLDDLTSAGREALLQAANQKKNQRPHLLKAAKFRMIGDIISQTLWMKNDRKAKAFLTEKYATGMNPDSIAHMVDATDQTIRNITRLWRTLGLGIGFTLFALILDLYLIEEGREKIKSLGVPELAMIPLDILLFPLGIIMGVYGSKISAKWSQARALNKIVPADILNRTLPKAGKTVDWSMILSAITIVIFCTLAVFHASTLPSWLSFLMSLLPVTAP